MVGVLLFSRCSREEDAPFIEVSREEITTGVSVSATAVNVTTNKAWSAESDQPWCRLSTSHGKGSEQIHVIVDETLQETHRTAIIRFTTDGKNADMASIIVFQQGLDEIEF